MSKSLIALALALPFGLAACDLGGGPVPSVGDSAGECDEERSDCEGGPAAVVPEVKGLSLSGVWLFQGSSRPLMIDGEPAYPDETLDETTGSPAGGPCLSDLHCADGLFCGLTGYTGYCYEPCDPGACSGAGCCAGGGSCSPQGECSGQRAPLQVAPENVRVPTIVGRPAHVRALVDVDVKSFVPAELKASLLIKDGRTLEDGFKVRGQSFLVDGETTFDFPLEGSDVGHDFAVAVEVRDAADRLVDRWPAAGFYAPATVDTGTLRLVLVPLRAHYNGGEHMPDLSEAQLALYKTQLFQLYPVADVELTVREPVDVYDVNDMYEALDKVVDTRWEDDPDPDVYYHGLFMPPTICEPGEAICAAGVAIGFGYSAWERASVGQGVFGEDSARTLVHEVGHTHGRPHAPCNIPGNFTDDEFPHEHGGIGAMGYDVVEGGFVNAVTTADFMGYCNLDWVSDFNFARIAGHMRLINRWNQPLLSSTPPRLSWMVIKDRPDGTLAWGRTIRSAPAPSGALKNVELLDESGGVIDVVKASALGLDHLPGGFLYLPALAVDEDKVASIRVDGRLLPLPSRR